MKRLLALVVLVLAATLLSARAQSPDEQYVHIYTLITQADALNEAGQSAQALGKYVEAQSALQRLQKVFPDWNLKVVGFRLNYLESKVASLTSKVPASTPPRSDTTNVQTTAQAATPTAQGEADRKLAALEDEVRRLQAERTVLEAKLKEALATQPASVDPRELAKAEEKIQSLMREKDLLEVAISRQKGETTPAVDPKALDEIKASLAAASQKLSERTERANSVALEKEALQQRFDKLASTAADTSELDRVKKELEAANDKLAGQTEQANKLALEKDALQKRFDSLAATAADKTELERVKKELEAANAKLTGQTELAGKLSGENAALQTRLNALGASAAAADALRAENELLKKQAADLKSAAVAAGSVEEEKNRRAQAEARLAALTSEVEILRLEKTMLQDRLKQVPSGGTENAARIKFLESEREDLRKQLAATEKRGFFSRRSKAGTARTKELTDQVNSMRARLAVLEARPVPYTPEEMALFQPPQTQLVAAESKTTGQSTGKSSKEPPPGATAVAAEARRLFSTKQFDKAEQKYLEILRQDENNVYTLANLAAIQLEMGHLDEAEKHVRQALASAPDDAYSLSILGYLKFRQEKYDDALGALSRAAQFDPQNAEIQNYLGVVLSHKGMREAAETALRKAIVIEPGYASAQNNLAVFYATGKPPLLGLARWHYQRALAAGHPRNEELEKMLEQKAPAPTAQ